uniref:Acyltransferase ACT6 n=1 Tax=Plectranthus barbatus TaxID=41228 RepID=A0A1B0VRQ7_9LAMI|nr:acyltransferase ACT6 [Plectranthus barbatus]
MVGKMKVEVVSRRAVKPCKPTPSHLAVHKISVLDELNPSIHVIRILYYESANSMDLGLLEESLAQVLPHFYPLAGRYNRDHHCVDCTDDGADFAVADVDCRLGEFFEVEAAVSENLDRLLPLDICAVDEPTDPLLAVQINRFQCGGIAVGVCASHRILDSATFGTFLTAWSNAACGGDSIISPDFILPSLFPSQNLPPLQFEVSRTRDPTIVSKMFRFNKKAISKLRERLTEKWESSTGSGRPPSRVVAVSTVLTQALLRSDKAKHGRHRISLIGQAINIRERTIPPVHKHSFGTWASLSYLKLDEKGTERVVGDFPEMAMKMREATAQGVKDCARILSDREFGRYVLVDSYFEAAQKTEDPDYKVVWVTDLSKFGDYEIDFGFGKPVWASMADVPLKDHFILLNTRDNEGIEAWVYLHESDMPVFEQDEELRILTG